MKHKQSLGQNFLMHQATAERIVAAAELSGKELVVEVGPGTGMLTTPLLAHSKKVLALETDRELIPLLSETFAKEITDKKLVLKHQDVRTFEPSSLKEKYVVVANIPYYITGEIIRLFLSASHKPNSMTVLVQKEVAERIVRSKKESLLSLSVKIYGIPKYCFTVSKGSFVPAPKVDSAVLSITNITNPFKNKKEEDLFFELLHLGFGHKRKQLLSNLESYASREKLEEVFIKIGLLRKARAEDLSLDSWKELARLLAK